MNNPRSLLRGCSFGCCRHVGKHLFTDRSTPACGKYERELTAITRLMHRTTERTVRSEADVQDRKENLNKADAQPKLNARSLTFNLAREYRHRPHKAVIHERWVRGVLKIYLGQGRARDVTPAVPHDRTKRRRLTFVITSARSTLPFRDQS